MSKASGHWWDKVDFEKLTPAEAKVIRDLMEGKRVSDVDLPHRTMKMYPWQREHYLERNRMCLLTASNQSGKSISQIRKTIEWACNKQLWPSLWESEPTHGWYLYPDKTTLDIEFNEKWQRILPGPQHKKDPHSPFSWKRYPSGDARTVEAVEFGSGFTVYFFTYTKRPQTLQAQSVYFIHADEELPAVHYDELQFRLSATRGYFSMVFTATLGQDLWRKAMEPMDYEEPLFPNAWKKQISQYDCLMFDDGTPGHYTPQMIQENIEKCQNKAEVQKRVFGRFVTDTNRLVPQFSPKEHVVKRHDLQRSWTVRGCVDMGSGGETGHPAAILFLATDPKQMPTRGKFFLGWKGTAGSETSSGDVYKQYVKMRDTNKLTVQRQIYDYESAEFRIVASRHQDPFVKANKDRKSGFATINTLFQHDALEIMLDPELGKLVSELMLAKEQRSKTNKTYDDLLDCARYLVMDVIWDMKAIMAGVARKERDEERLRLSTGLVDVHGKPLEAEIHKNMAEFVPKVYGEDVPPAPKPQEYDRREEERRLYGRKEEGMVQNRYYREQFEEINSQFEFG